MFPAKKTQFLTTSKGFVFRIIELSGWQQ